MCQLSEQALNVTWHVGPMALRTESREQHARRHVSVSKACLGKPGGFGGRNAKLPPTARCLRAATDAQGRSRCG